MSNQVLHRGEATDIHQTTTSHHSFLLLKLLFCIPGSVFFFGISRLYDKHGRPWHKKNGIGTEQKTETEQMGSRLTRLEFLVELTGLIISKNPAKLRFYHQETSEFGERTGADRANQ